jgi:hypothetical protein
MNPGMNPEMTCEEKLLHEIANALGAASKVQPGREASIVRTKLDEAMMWAQRVHAISVPVVNEKPGEA